MMPSLHRCSTLAIVMLTALAGCSDNAPPTPPATAGGGGFGGSGGFGGGSGGAMDLLPVFSVEGVVVDGSGMPIEGATVLQGGKPYDLPHIMTGADGAFSIEVTYPGYGVPGIVAFAPEHRAGGAEFYKLPTEPVELTLIRVNAPDNLSYTYGEPGLGADPSTKFCGHCHSAFAAQFQTSKHAEATRDPLVQDLYAGVTQAHGDMVSCIAAGGAWKQGLVPGTASAPIAKCYLGGGVLPDLNTGCGSPAEFACDDPSLSGTGAPTAFGTCADCHAPGIDGVAGGRDLHEAVGIAFDHGVHCDVCHKVKDIDPDLAPGVAGRLILQRPAELSNSPLSEFLPVYYGPLLDVPNAFMGAVYQPKFKEAVFCSGCHEQNQPALIPGDMLDTTRWPDGLPIHTTYSEWQAGPYAASGTPCQFCHMPSNHELVNTIDTATVDNQSITFGYPRPPEDIRQHIFRSPLVHGDPRLIDSALFVSINLAVNAGEVNATVSVANIGCGHAIPTGEPMRSLVMLVDAQGGGCGQPLPAAGGMTVNDVGGALARGVEGQDVTTAGTVMSWAAGAQVASAGQVVRVVRPSGVFDDYTGVGFFADPMLTPAEKGLEIHEPVGEAAVVSAAAGQLQLAQALTLNAGDLIFLGDAVSGPTDGQGSLRLAGAAGYTFAKVLADAAGTRNVAHYRAVNIASDNRIPPGDNAITTHSFSIMGGCTSAIVNAVVLYRPIPTEMGALRGWDAKDYVIATAQATIPLP